MPIGVLVNVVVVIIGGLLGGLVGKYLSTDFKEKLNMIFGACAMTMGISSICLMENMPAVIFSVVFGTSLGLAIHFGNLVNTGGRAMQKVIGKFIKNPSNGMSDKEFTDELVTVIVLFCASGTGIYGTIVSGMNGDHSILISKSILDLPMAMIFACSLGVVVAFIAVPQLVIFMLLFMLAGVIYPMTSPSMINDFKACGGVLLLATGFRMIKVKMFPVADMIPAMVLVMPVSWMWVTYVLPLVTG